MEKSKKVGQTPGPVIHDLQWKLGTLQRRRGRLKEQIDAFDALPADSAMRERRANAHEYDRKEYVALEAALVALEYHRRTIDDEVQGAALLGALVDAVRSQTAARTAEERAMAAAEIEEAMRHAAPYVDNLR